MALKRKLLRKLLLIIAALDTTGANSRDLRKSVTERKKYKAHLPNLKIDKGNPWPFLPSAGTHYAAPKGYPNYPFIIVSPPGREKESDEKQNDQQGSKYSLNRRQFVSVPYAPQAPQQNIVGYLPVYFAPQHYEPVYTAGYFNQPNAFANPLASQVVQPYFSSGGQNFIYSDYPLVQKQFLFSKRSHSKKPREENQLVPRQFVPRHHWAFSQWPFDSHEYAFTKNPLYGSNLPHLPRWGPIEWGGAGPGRHWGINRESLPSPFGIGLAPHMGGQGYLGLSGNWPAGYGYPLPSNFPTPARLQHLLP